MYQAKAENAGYAFYDEASCGTHDPGRLTLVGELRRALEQRELDAATTSPRPCWPTARCTRSRRSLRWNHPARGLVGPDEFIPLAQQTGLIKPLTLYVIDEALRQCRAWLEAGERLAIAVNLSTRNLLDIQFPTEVQGLLDRWRIDARAARARDHRVDDARRPDAHEADPRAALGAWASGCRSTTSAPATRRSPTSSGLPVDEIKIDRSFVMGMDRSEDDATIVRSTIDLGRNLGLEVVAEGVETEAVWNRLDVARLHVAQGYYLSRPVPPAELRAWLAARRAAARARRQA